MATIQAWQSGYKYAAGDLVTYNGVTYQALVGETSIAAWDPLDTPSLWSTVSTQPPMVPQADNSSPTQAQNTDVAAWSAAAVYTAGMQASENGIIYQANWWTQGNDPVSNNGAQGTGEPWTIVNPTAPPPPPVPTAPTGLAAANTTDTATTLSWNAASVPGGGSVTAYGVFENGQQIATTTALTYAVSGLAADTSYGFAVDALDSSGASPQSASITVITTAPPPPPPPPPPPVDGVAAWSATAVYTGGMQASEDGGIYQANWWNQGTDPLYNTGPQGSGQVWSFVGGTPPTIVPPPAPTDVQALGTTNSVTFLTWTAPTVPWNTTITGYAVLQDGQQIGTASGPGYVVTGLAPSSAHHFSVEAIDAAGNSVPSAAIALTTAATVPNLVQNFSPYVDMGLMADENLVAISQASGVKDFTLAFIQSSGPDSIGWAGVGTIQQDSYPDGGSILQQVQAIQAAGGRITISFGGENGTDPAAVATSAAQPQAEYQSVLDYYHVNALDFDIEGGQVADQSAITLRDQALVGLKAANPDLTISFTLPVLPSGLDSNGVKVLQSAKADGLDPNVINVMAMDYGGYEDNGGAMGVDAITAAINTEQQIQQAGLTSKVGVTPMIGVNDVSSEIFSQADAQMLLDFAQGNPAIASIGMWSIARDNGSSAGAHYASPDSSGLAQSDYAFAQIFRQLGAG